MVPRDVALQPAFAGSQGEILVVDDDPDDLRALSQLLLRQGYRVRVAMGGAQGLRSACLASPDLVLLDVMMPDLDGYQVCRHLKANPLTRAVPVLFLSGLVAPEDKSRAFEAGGEDYVTKPFEEAEVLARVRVHLARRRAEAALRETNERLQSQLAEIETLHAELRRWSEGQIRLLSMAVEQSPSLIIVADPGGAIQYVNPAFTRATGYTLEEMAGRTAHTFWLADASNEVALEVKESVAAGREWRGEFQSRKKSGEPFWVHATVSPLRSAGGAITHFVQVEEDISRRRQAEEEAYRQASLARALSLRLIDAQESERRTVARELHDEIGQVLTWLMQALDVRRQLPPGPVASGLAEAREMADNLLRQVRNLSLDLRPSMLDDQGLLPALLWLIDRYADRTRLRVGFTHSGLKERRFDPRVESVAYRVVQEALANVVRHARVGDVEVRLWAGGQSLDVEVVDQGIGFSPETVGSSATSGGLAGVQDRVRLLGGRLAIESAPGAGTRLAAKLPLKLEEGDTQLP